MVNILDTVRVRDFGLEGIVVSATKNSASILTGAGMVIPFKKALLDILSPAPESTEGELARLEREPGDIFQVGDKQYVYVGNGQAVGLPHTGGWGYSSPRGDAQVVVSDGQAVNIDPLGVLVKQAHEKNFASVVSDEDMLDYLNPEKRKALDDDELNELEGLV